MKKFLCVTLSLLMVLSCLCACSTESKKEQTTNSAVDTLNITNDSHYDTIDESSMRTYKKLANAIINGDSTFLFNIQMLDNVNQLLYTSFPLIALVKSVNMNDDKTGVVITYNNDIETHKKLVAEFADKVSTIMTECEYGKVNDNVYLINVYTYVATHITYDNKFTTVYDAIVNEKGMSASISGMFEYLLLQGSVKACHTYSTDAAGNSWFWSQAYIGNNLYNFDISAELDRREGKGLSCFAMTDKEIVASGIKKGFMYSDKSKAVECNNTSYKKLRSCRDYTISGSTIKAELYSGDTIDVELI